MYTAPAAPVADTRARAASRLAQTMNFPAVAAPDASVRAMPITDAESIVALNLQKAEAALKAVVLDVRASGRFYRITDYDPERHVVTIERIDGNGESHQVNLIKKTCTCGCAHTHLPRWNQYLAAAGDPRRYRCKHAILVVLMIVATQGEVLDLFTSPKAQTGGKRDSR